MSHKKLTIITILTIAILTCSYFVAANFGFFSGGTNAPSVPEDTMTRGLVGYWEFEEGTGQTAYDGSDSSNDGQLGSTASSDDNDPVWSKGKNGGGMSFDGVDDYVDMGSGSSLNVTSAITIEAWIKPDALTPTWQTIVDRRSDGSTRQYGLLLNSDEVKFSFYNGGWQGTVTTSANLTIGNWYNITATYSDSANLTIIYINGIEIISAVENLSLTVDDTSVKIGIGYLGDAPFNGSIDDVRIYNRALSADEVRYHYNRGGPVGSWNFDEGSGLTAFDGTENNNDGTLKSSGLEFDGVDDYVAYSSDPPIGPVTFTAWFKTNDINQNQVIVGKIFGEVAFVRYGIGLIIHDFKVKGIYALNNVEWQQNLQYVIENDQWYHVAVTFSDGNGSVGQSDVTGKLYVNGELKAEHIGTATWYQDFKNAIGEGDPYGNNFNGSIDEVRIYNTALSAEEIARHYNNDFSQDPTANLVLLQHFEEGMACDANDEAGCLTDDSPSGTNDGTLKNFDNLTAWDNGTDGWVSEVKKPEWRWVNGKYKTAGEFNGWDDYVDGGDSDNLSPANAYTFSAWVKPTGTNIISLVDKGGIGGNREYRIALFNNSDVYNANYIQILIGDSSGNWAKIWYPNVVVQKDIWSHLAMTWDNSGSGPVKVYLNSVNVANSTYTGTLKNTTSDLLIGANTVAVGSLEHFFDGSIDDVRIYSYARTADEIRLDYNAGVATHFGPSGKTCSQDPTSCMDYGLVGSWGMDEGMGTTAYDGSDNSNNGILTNGPKWTTDSSPLAGSGGSLNFDGVDDYVNILNSSSLDSPNTTTEVTVMAWINPTSYVSNGRIVSRIVSAGTGSWGLWQASTTGNIRFIVDYGASFASAISTDAPITYIGKWQCVVGTYDGSNIKVYYNGVLKKTTAQVGTIDSSSLVTTIGGRVGELFSNGSIDDVCIYNRALSAEEVRYHYNKGGPVAEWKFNEGSGQTAFDFSNNNNDGTLGASSAVDTDDPTWVEGKYSGALSFDGVDDYVDTTDINEIDGATQLSGCAWVKMNDLGSDGAIFAKDSWVSTSQLLLWRDDDAGVSGRTNTFTMLVSDGTNSARIEGATGQLNDLNWHFISFTFIAASSTGLRVYVDGVEDPNSPVSTSSITALSSNSNIFRIGQVVPLSTGKYFNGSIDDVRIYDYARTADEIRLDYNAGMATHLGPSGKTCSEDPAGCMDYGLVGSWGMDEGTGTTAYDSSDNSNDGTLTGGPTWTTDSPPLTGGGGSLKFDGVDDYVSITYDDSLDIETVGTISMWVNPNINWKNWATFLDKSNATAIGYRISRYNNTNELSFFDGTSSVHGGNIAVGSQNHITIVINNGTSKGYINGVEVFNGAIKNPLSENNAPVFIGKEYGTSIFNGSIDSVRIYNRALSAEEVRYHYNKGGPVAEWKFDEGSGQTAFDESWNNNDGTLGATSGVEASDPTWVEGKYGGALSFDGGDDYVDTNSSNLNLLSTNTITISAWIKFSDHSTDGHIASDYNRSQPNGWAVALNSSEKFLAMNLQGSGVNQRQRISSALTIGQWYHAVAIIYPNNNFPDIYINGKLDNSEFAENGTVTQLNMGSTNVIIGRQANYSTQERYFNGSIDDVRIYNYARTAEQIQMDYNAGVGTHFR